MLKASKKIDQTVLQSKNRRILTKTRRYQDPDTQIISKSSKRIQIRVDTEDLERIGKLILMTELPQNLKKETEFLSNPNNFNKKQ